MDTYSLLREIADSWVLLALFIFFIGQVINHVRRLTYKKGDDV